MVEAIGLSLLQKGRFLLRGHHRLVLAGCFSGSGEQSWESESYIIITRSDT